MAFTPAPGEQYTIRRKVFKLFGAGFHIYAADGSIAGYCQQKAFKLKEDLRIYTDESKSTELFRIGARSVLDFGATYDVSLPTGERLGSFRRKALKSLLRDTWHVFGASGNEIGTIKEDSAAKATLRRLMASTPPCSRSGTRSRRWTGSPSRRTAPISTCSCIGWESRFSASTRSWTTCSCWPAGACWRRSKGVRGSQPRRVRLFGE